MSYEIPQELEYKEKIIFGLTFEQLLYVVIFSPIALALLFKTPFDQHVRITLSFIPCAIAIVFMFTKIPKEIRNWAKWLSWQHMDQANMKRFLEVEGIEKGVLLLK